MVWKSDQNKHDGWIAANLKPLRLRAYSQIVIKYAFC